MVELITLKSHLSIVPILVLRSTDALSTEHHVLTLFSAFVSCIRMGSPFNNVISTFKEFGL